MILHDSIFLMFLFIVIIIEALLIIRDRKQKNEKSVDDKGSRILIVAVLLLALGLSVAFRFMRIGYYHIECLFWTGVCVSIAGLSFRMYSIRILGKSFSSNITSYTGQTLIVSGPYTYLRHPCYSAIILMTIGFGFVSESWVAMPVLIIPAAGSLMYRIHVEEQFMVNVFGEEYRRYMEKTKRLVPFVF